MLKPSEEDQITSEGDAVRRTKVSQEFKEEKECGKSESSDNTQ